MLTPERLNRIRWRSRRGMLENDIVLTRFLDARGGTLTDVEVAMLDRLLDLPDNDLWDLIAGRQEPRDATVGPLLAGVALRLSGRRHHGHAVASMRNARVVPDGVERCARVPPGSTGRNRRFARSPTP